ncbi:hypothetical protein V8E36_008398 [Tilletia maclaganii]
MAGLGIDLGPDMTSPRRPSGPRERSRSRSHTVTSESRRVRIASGQPRILGVDLSPDCPPSKPKHGRAQPQRSVSMAGPTPPMTVSNVGTSSTGIFDSYGEAEREGYLPDGFGGWVKAEDIGNGKVPAPMTPSDSPLIITAAPKSKIQVTNPSPTKSMLTPPTSEPSTSPNEQAQAVHAAQTGSTSPASLALSDITVSSECSTATSNSSSPKKSVRKLISARRPSSAAGDDGSNSGTISRRDRSRSRSMSLFLGRPKSATGHREDKDKLSSSSEQGSSSERSSPSKSSGKSKLSKSRSHASLVSWSATGWAGTGHSHEGLGLDLGSEAEDEHKHESKGSPSSLSEYSDQDPMTDLMDVTITAAEQDTKAAFRGPAQQLYDSPVRCSSEETPRPDQPEPPHPPLRSNTRSSSRLNAQAAEFNPRPPTAVAMAPAPSRQVSMAAATLPARQLSSNSIASTATYDSAATANGGIPRMRSMRFWAGLEGASRGEAMVCLDPVTGQFVQGEAIVPGRIVNGRNAGQGVGEDSILAEPSGGADPYGSISATRGGAGMQNERNASAPVAGGATVSDRNDAASMSRRDSNLSWIADSNSELGPHDSASNVGRAQPHRAQAAHLQPYRQAMGPPKTIHRQQSVPVLPSASARAASQAHNRALHHQQSLDMIALGLQDPTMDGAQGGVSMDRRANHTVTGAGLSAEERRRRHATMLTQTSHNSASTSTSSGSSLDRSGTLLSATANPARRSRELHRLLGNSTRKLNASAARAAAASGAGDGARASTFSLNDGLNADGDSGLEIGTSSGPGSGLGIESLGGPLSSTVVPGMSGSKSISSGAVSSLAGNNSMAPPTVGGGNALANRVAVLEQAKSGRARVEVDLVLETDLAVEGGSLRGRVQIKVRKPQDGEGAVMLAQPKIRIVGFEELLGDDTRHIFYHHAMAIDGDRSNGGPSEPYVLHGSPNVFSPEAAGGPPLPCFAGSPDMEGYCRGKEGVHEIPFALDIPIGRGAKGSYRGKTAVVRYIVIGSVKLKGAAGADRSIAHFYRHVELFPYLNPAAVLAAAPKPILSRAEKGLFMGGTGKVLLNASLHRSTWVAGQRVYVNIGVRNETTKKVKNLHLALVRTVTLFRPKPEFNVGFSVPSDPAESYIDPDACTTSTNKKKICEETLELGQKGSKGSVTARGWWTGVDPGCSIDVSHYMTIPAEALTISRGRHVEVMYSIKVAVSGTFSSDVSVELPLRVINFVSLDPPPAKHGTKSGLGPATIGMSRTWSQAAHLSEGADGPRSMGLGLQTPTTPVDEAPMIARVRSMDALRSPTKAGPASAHLPIPAPRGMADLGALGARANGAGEERQSIRRLQHQKSLDFINHAIRSATARRGLPSSTANSPLGLGIEVPDDEAIRSMEYREGQGGGNGVMPTDHLRRLSMASLHSHAPSTIGPIDPNCMPYVHPQMTMPHLVPPALSINPQLLLNSVTLDEAGDDYDEVDRRPRHRSEYGYPNSATSTPLSLNDDSVDELDIVVHSTQMEGLPVFGVDPALAHGDDDDEDGNTTFDSVSTARYIREEDEDVQHGDAARTRNMPIPQLSITAPLQFNKKAAGAEPDRIPVVPEEPELDDFTPTSFQSSTFEEAREQNSPSSDSEIGTAEVSLHHSPSSSQGDSPQPSDEGSPACDETKSDDKHQQRKDGMGAFAEQVSERARNVNQRRHRGGRGRGGKTEREAVEESRAAAESRASSKGSTGNSASPPSASGPSSASLRRTRSNIEDAISVSSGSNSRPCSRASSINRSPSPSKLAGSPKKSALKKKSSFTFATLDTPLKMQKEQMAREAVVPEDEDAAAAAATAPSPPTVSAAAQAHATVAKAASAAQLVKSSAGAKGKGPSASTNRASASAPSSGSVASKAPAASQSKDDSTTARVRASAAITSKASQSNLGQATKRSSTSVAVPVAKVRGATASAAAGTLKAKVSSSSILPTKHVEAPAANSNSKRESSRPAKAAPMGTTLSRSRAVKGKSEKTKLRHAASLADLDNKARSRADSMDSGATVLQTGASAAESASKAGKPETPERADKTLQRSTSTHNLRGSAIVIPSVRNKIAMLESRSQLLRDFAAPLAGSGSGSPAAGNSSMSRSPSVSNQVGSADTSVVAAEVPVRRGGGSGSSASAATGTLRSTASSTTLGRRSSVVNLQSTPDRFQCPSRMTTSASMGAALSSSSTSTSTSTRLLARKPSVLSIAASEDSVATSATGLEYLRRSDSLMSFKAPVLRSVKALVEQRERGA